jgi:signal transduction histidine kinase
LEERSLAERRMRMQERCREGCELLATSAAELRRRGCALVFADADGVLLSTHGADLLPDAASRAAFQAGVRWDEASRGTNAIGTAIAENTAIAVIGRAHLEERGHGLVCYAAPVHDAQGALVGVLDISGPLAAADPLLGITVQSLASAIEGLVRAGEVIDLSEQLEVLRQRENEAVRVKEQLAATLRQSETFLATVGHDLRNPLAAMMTGADLLAGRVEDPRALRAAQRIQVSGRRMARMIDELYDLARFRLGSGVPLRRREGVDLAVVSERVAGEMRLAHPEREIDLALRGDARGHWDEVRVEQVLANLLGNALRHGSTSEPIEVHIDATMVDIVALSVSNGGEIEPSVRPHLFQPFRSGKPSASRARSEGLGLGLYIVEQAVLAHGGAIEVSSAAGSTTFHVTLPRRAPSPVASSVATALIAAPAWSRDRR